MKKNYLLTFLWLFIGTAFSFAHDSSVHHHSLKTWNLKNKEEIKASFLFISDDIVSLEDDKGKIELIQILNEETDIKITFPVDISNKYQDSY